MKKIIFLFFIFLPLYGSIENSILPQMDAISLENLEGKINSFQKTEMEEALHFIDQKIRVISFNMLTELTYERKKLDAENEWPKRRERVVSYLREADADIIGSQELTENMISYLMSHLGDDYACFGQKIDHDCQKTEIPAVFYRKSRFQLVKGETIPYEDSNGFTVCLFKDLITQKELLVCNTHFSFFDPEKRLEESFSLGAFAHCKLDEYPVIVTGDLNTFPFRPALSLPFYDGNAVLANIENECLADVLGHSLFGSFGALGSTNFCFEKKRPFCLNGASGVILDHIFVSFHFKVLSAGIDPAKIDGFFPSDHFPVVADLIFNYPTVTILPAKL